MINIFLNGYSSIVGGGKLIFDNLVFQIQNDRSYANFNYFILVRDYDAYRHLNSNNVTVVRLNPFFSHKVVSPLLYFLVIPYLLVRYKIDFIFNLGDIIIPTSVKQIYFFDWAYAIDDSKYIWDPMPFQEKIVRSTKKYLIGRYIGNLYHIYCQTDFMRQSLISKFQCSSDNIEVFETPVGGSIIERMNFVSTPPSNSRKKIFYPSSFNIHKNFDFILQLGKLITDNKMSIDIILTIEKSESVNFWNKISEEGISSIITLGRLSPEKVALELESSDALFFPSLLESYGIPLVEAMAFKKPILVSDLPYARALCKNSAIYFDPFDPNKAIESLDIFLNENNLVKENINNAYVRFCNLPNWTDFYKSLINKFK